jgi:F0F1-type ATP synthase delta subunit
MKKNVTSSNKLEFQYSKFNRIDSKKHNLYDVLSDPKLDNITINERLSILNSLVEDAQLNEMGNFLRYSSD